MKITNTDVSHLVELLGTSAFTISGIFSAIQKKLDLFGVLMIGFITALGGGTILDLLIGIQPVSWMTDMTAVYVIGISGTVAVLFRGLLKSVRIPLFIFDTLGLGLYTVSGIQKGLRIGLNPMICIALGTISACFGAILRDMLLGTIPVLFKKEIYATACIAGGILYCLLLPFFELQISELIALSVICAIRIAAVKYKWQLPAVRSNDL